MNASQQISARHFGAAIVRKLARKGITVTGLMTIPGNGPMPYPNGSTGYTVNDNGTGKVWTFADVLKAAE
jgi:hypothetical protein